MAKSIMELPCGTYVRLFAHIVNCRKLKTPYGIVRKHRILEKNREGVFVEVYGEPGLVYVDVQYVDAYNKKCEC